MVYWGGRGEGGVGDRDSSGGVGQGGVGVHGGRGAEKSARRPESPNSFGFPGGDSSHAKGRANRES